jgi:2,5-diketo-D-gluconate reductase B
MAALKFDRICGIPNFGFGTFPLRGDEAFNAVRTAIDLGIRHIDTAQMYGNEKDVGRAIKQPGVARGELFVVTKVDPSNIGRDRFAESVAKSVDDLNGPVDLLLIHWPPEDRELEQALDRLMREKQKGNARAIGVSNFSAPMLRKAHAHTNGAIINNQVEFHPLLDQSQLLATARELGLALSAYCPLARGAALKNRIIQAIAQRLGRQPAEVALRWIVQQGVIPVPMSTKRDNIASNLNALGFELSAEDMAAISAIGTRGGRLINPGWMAGRWDN